MGVKHDAQIERNLARIAQEAQRRRRNQTIAGAEGAALSLAALSGATAGGSGALLYTARLEDAANRFLAGKGEGPSSPRDYKRQQDIVNRRAKHIEYNAKRVAKGKAKVPFINYLERRAVPRGLGIGAAAGIGAYGAYKLLQHLRDKSSKGGK